MLKTLIFKCFLISFIVIFINCKNDKSQSRVINEAFYYWKNTLPKTDFDTSYLKQLSIKRLYIKLFDIGFETDKGVVPISALAGNFEMIPAGIECVPTVFITNESFIKTDSAQIQMLAQNVFNKIQSYYTPSVSTGFKVYKEVQIDCDWSEKTRNKYFKFLKILKSILPPNVQLSVTIRLHQVKYRTKTGIPPVDRGILMMYNVLNPTTLTDKNSIFDEKEVKAYLHNQKPYALPLDVAYPIFSWGVVYHNNKFIRLINCMTRRNADTANWLEKSKSFYIFNKDTLIENYYFRMGDMLKIEDITPSVLSTCTELARPIILNDTLNISFFHYDTQLINDITPNQIEQVFKAWH